MTAKQTALTIIRLADPLPDELRPTAEAEAHDADVVAVPYELTKHAQSALLAFRGPRRSR